MIPPFIPSPRAERDSAAYARQIWSESRAIDGTPAEHYLIGRGLRGPWPPSLRYAPSLRHAPTASYLPALVAGVTAWPDRFVTAIQRTYLAGDGSGKADVEPAKMALGPCSGGAVRLAPDGETLVLGEGVETALSVQQEVGVPAWAALGAGNLATVVLPDLPTAREVIVAADADDAGLQAAYRAVERFTAEGRRVRLARPQNGDFNDLLRGAA